MSRLLRLFGALAAASLAVVAVACSGVEEPAAPVESASTVSPTQIAPVAPTPATAAPTPTEDYDSTKNMFLLNSGGEYDAINSHEAVRLAVANNDKSMVPVMIEMLRFFGTWALVTETQNALTAITGHEVNNYSRGWFEWMEWLGKNADEYQPPDRYVEWKIDLMTPISYRFEGVSGSGGERLADQRLRDRMGRRPARRHPASRTGPGRDGGQAGLHAADRPGLRGVDQRIAQGVPAPHRERP